MITHLEQITPEWLMAVLSQNGAMALYWPSNLRRELEIPVSLNIQTKVSNSLLLHPSKANEETNKHDDGAAKVWQMHIYVK